jgi:hypothetical protein
LGQVNLTALDEGQYTVCVHVFNLSLN